MSARSLNKVKIFLAEDNQGDIRLFSVALETWTSEHILVVATDGAQALELLEKMDSTSLPDLIILDINMPKKSGFEVLAWIKKHVESLRRIPVIVMSSSSTPCDIQESYNLQANCFVQKGIKFEDLLKIIKSFEDFWIHTVSLPNRTPDSQKM